MFDITSYQSPTDTTMSKTIEDKINGRLDFIEKVYALVKENRQMINSEGRSLLDLMPKVSESAKVAFDKKLTAWKQLVVGVDTLYKMYIAEKK